MVNIVHAILQGTFFNRKKAGTDTGCLRQSPSKGMGLGMRVLCALLGCFLAVPVSAQLYQSSSYEVRMAPYAWYNSTDGILAGVQFRGEQPGTFLHGPHRIRAGMALASRWPEHPVSYFFSWTHPLELLSRPMQEGALHVSGSMQAGLHHYKAGIQKRFDPGVKAMQYTDLHLHAGWYNRFSHAYLLHAARWQHDAAWYVSHELSHTRHTSRGKHRLAILAVTGAPISPDAPFTPFTGPGSAHVQELGIEGLFTRVHLVAQNSMHAASGFGVDTRLFAGTSTAGTPVEWRYMASGADAFQQSSDPFSRARGTIPAGWMRNGLVHTGGGPGLRSYTEATYAALNSGEPAWVQHALSLAADVHYPNFADRWLRRVPYSGDMLRLRSYVYAETGRLHERGAWQSWRAAAGAGFTLSVSIPDYLGSHRGLFVRYELPLWLSEPMPGNNPLGVRHLLGLGAHMRF